MADATEGVERGCSGGVREYLPLSEKCLCIGRNEKERARPSEGIERELKIIVELMDTEVTELQRQIR